MKRKYTLTIKFSSSSYNINEISKYILDERDNLNIVLLDINASATESYYISGRYQHTIKIKFKAKKKQRIEFIYKLIKFFKENNLIQLNFLGSTEKEGFNYV